ncbi:MAG: 1-acyl-sn-glycerol-3-phosphate acyltransferase [Bdellovibrionales bacterium]|nr:1-acyl-sn-glycerol-3-phosphate acyltransferase [Bdellovibrionales bacterium]
MKKLFRLYIIILICSLVCVPQTTYSKNIRVRLLDYCDSYLNTHQDLRFVLSDNGTKMNLRLLKNSSFPNKLINFLFSKYFGPKLGMIEYGEILQVINSMPESENNFVKYQKALMSTYHLTRNSAQKIPKHGPLLIVANHPGAGWEIFSIVEFVLKTRSDFKILANEVLASIPGLGDSFIPVPILQKKQSEALKQAEQQLEQDGVLIVFPSATVSHYVIGKSQNGEPIVVDGPWTSALMRVIKRVQPSIVPIHVDSQPTETWLEAVEKGGNDTLRVLNHFGNEILSHRGEDVPLTVGRAIEANVYLEKIGLKDLFPTLRRATYLLNSITLPDTLIGQNEKSKELDVTRNNEAAKLWLP